MADVTPILINQLAAQTTLSDSDYFIVGGSDAKKITVAQMKEALGINALNGNFYTTVEKPGDVLSVTTEIMNRWYFVSTENGNYNFPKGVSWGFVRYLRIGSIILCELLSVQNGSCHTNAYVDNNWTGWA